MHFYFPDTHSLKTECRNAVFKTAIIVSQNSEFCSRKQGTDRLFPLVNAMKESDYIVYQSFIYLSMCYGYVNFSFYAYMHLTMEKLCE